MSAAAENYYSCAWLCVAHADTHVIKNLLKVYCAYVSADIHTRKKFGVNLLLTVVVRIFEEMFVHTSQFLPAGCPLISKAYVQSPSGYSHILLIFPNAVKC